jgi:hypothetical protein
VVYPNCGKNATVEIKFLVEGATGTVLSAIPQGWHASTRVGKCLAAAAKNARFPKFKSLRQTFHYKYRL